MMDVNQQILAELGGGAPQAPQGIDPQQIEMLKQLMKDPQFVQYLQALMSQMGGQGQAAPQAMNTMPPQGMPIPGM